MSTIVLARGRVLPVWAGHPWVYAQAIERIEGAPSAGGVVDVMDPSGNHLGRGYYSPRSAIPVRIMSRDPHDPLEGASIGRRIEDAAALRRKLGLPSPETTGYRLVHAEGDHIPGLIVDVLGDIAAVQLLTLGMKLREEDVFAHVARVTHATTVMEIASPAAETEGFESVTRVVRGPDPTSIAFLERGFRYDLEPAVTQKTGFYFDQRENRAWAERVAAGGARVLDLHAFVGAFALAAARGGAASVRAVDSSAPAIATLGRLAHANGYGDRIVPERSDVRKEVERLRRAGERFDVVILDPPKLAPSMKHLEKARTMYRKLNEDAARLVAPGGWLLSSSCSAAMVADDFVRTATLGARDGGKDLVLVHLGTQGPDHPTPAAFAEGRYLKFAVFRVHAA